MDTKSFIHLCSQKICLIKANLKQIFPNLLVTRLMFSFVLLLTFGSSQMMAQIVINEVSPSGTVELKNIGSTTIEVGDYWLCNFPNYEQIQSSTILCGSTLMEPGAILAVENDDLDLNNSDDEMGLYSSAAFGSASAILDYVEWGFAGHGRASVAIAASIWSADAFVPSIPVGGSIQFDGMGDTPADWAVSANSTICEENTTDTECDVVVGDITLADGSTSTSICVDGVADPLEVITSGGSEVSTGWIITDDAGNILALPMAPPFDLDGAGVGICEIWYIRYETLEGNEVGNNLSDLMGCFDLSNPITVIREAPDGGTVSLLDGGTTYTGTAGDIMVQVQHENESPNLSYWYIITDANDNILGFLNSAVGNTLDLSPAPPGECHIWGWSYRGLPDPVLGENISTLNDDSCEEISDNFITVIREATECDVFTGDITLADGSTSTSICVDGVADPLEVITSGGSEVSTGWIITDDAGNILALPMAPPFDLDGAGVGICEIWYIRYETLEGNEVGNNLSDLMGCFDLSNPITVIREAPDGGTVSLLDGGTTYTGTAGDIMVQVQHENESPNLSYWYIITDANDNILGFLNSAVGNTLDLSPAPPGECHIWGWSYRGLPDPVLGENISTLNDDSCEEISDNFITVIREATECDVFTGDITLADGSTSTSICVDGVADPLEVITSGGSEVSTGWIITDDAGNILALPMAPPFDLDGAGVGICEIWYIRYETLEGNEVGNNLSDLMGCFDLSNPITVIREAPDGGTVSLLDGGTTYTGTAGDIMVQVQHENESPNLSYWYIITDANDNILGFLNSAVGNTLDLSPAPPGECHIWGWSYRGLPDPVLGENISTLNDDSCEEISDNFITVIREATAEGADLKLDVTVDNALYNQFDNRTFQITLYNEGSTDVNDIVVSGKLPENTVFTSASSETGSYSLFNEVWVISNLAPGESAVLDLTLFALTGGSDITFYTEVLEANPADVDSTPGNGDGVTPNEDDEASVSISPADNGGFGSDEGNADLELSIEANLDAYTIYEPITFRITVNNTGTDAAELVNISTRLPEGLVFTSETTTLGEFSLFFENWTIDVLEAGQSAYLDLTLFPLISGTDISNFVEVFSVLQQDPDSTPANGDGLTPNEDDEAIIVLPSASIAPFSTPEISALAFRDNSMVVNALFPNPATDRIALNIVSIKEVEGARIRVVNQNGQVVRQVARTIDMGLNELNFNIGDLSEGIYYIQIEGLKVDATASKFVKLK